MAVNQLAVGGGSAVVGVGAYLLASEFAPVPGASDRPSVDVPFVGSLFVWPDVAALVGGPALLATGAALRSTQGPSPASSALIGGGLGVTIVPAGILAFLAAAED